MCNVAEPTFLKQVDRELSETPVATWSAYLKWQLLASASPWLSRSFAEESFRFAGGVSERAQRCVESTEALLGDAVGEKVRRADLPPGGQGQGRGDDRRRLVALLKEDVAPPGLDGARDARSRRSRSSRRTTRRSDIPHRWKTYSTVDHSPRRAVGERRRRATVRRRRQPPPRRQADRPRPVAAPRLVPRRLHRSAAEPDRPAGRLPAGAGFSLDATDAVNYGAIGIGVAHDLTHTIDAWARRSTPRGARGRGGPTATARRSRRAPSASSTSSTPPSSSPASTTRASWCKARRSAISAGVWLAYRALARSMARHPVPVVRRFHCGAAVLRLLGSIPRRGDSPGGAAAGGEDDPHPVPKFRVIGPLANSPEFQQAFSAGRGAEMVRPPETRCAVW